MSILLLCVAIFILMVSYGTAWPVSLLVVSLAFVNWKFDKTWWMFPVSLLALFLLATGWIGVAIIIGAIAFLIRNTTKTKKV